MNGRTQVGELSVLQERILTRLSQLEAQDQRRSLTPIHTTSGTLDFTTNDYLGLRDNATFQQRCRLRIDSLPVGSGASRLLGGEHPIFAGVENAFAAFKGAESALYFSSGYAANEAIFSALQQQDFHLFSDALNHASIIDGIRLSRWPKEHFTIVPHRDLNALEIALKNSIAPCNVIALESVFSMDGDVAPLKAYAELAAQYRGVLVIDEAHALGVFGERGSGCLEAEGLSHKSVITVNPCGKGMAASGAFICGPRWLRDYLINTARPFIFSTAPSPWIAAALLESIQTVEGMKSERTMLQERGDMLRSELKKLGYNIGVSASPIIPVIMGANHAALHAAKILSEHGFNIKAVRPPTVPENTARLRLSLTASMKTEDLQRLASTFATLRGKT